MNRTSRLILEAKKASELSPMKPKMGAILTRGSRIIKQGYNTPGKPKFIGSWSRHAEVRATLNVNSQDATIYVYREHAQLHSPLLAKPCNHCIEWLKFVGIKEVVFTVPTYPFYEVWNM